MKKFITDFRTDRDLTLEQFSRELGYPSKTSLSRLMRGEAGPKATEAFAAKLRKKFVLTEKEESALRMFLDQCRFGSSESVHEMEYFLSMKGNPQDGLIVEGKDGERSTFKERYLSTSELGFILVNSIYANIYISLQRLIRMNGAKVAHYILEDNFALQVGHSINAIFPIVYERNYTGFTMRRCGACSGFQGADVAFVTYTDKKGKKCAEHLVFDGPSHCYVLNADDAVFSEKLFSSVLEEWRLSGLQEIKKTFFHCSMMENYIGYSSEYADIEDNCGHFIIKPDPCIALIPVEILKAAFCDQFPDADAALVSTLVSIYTKRFNNIRNKNSPTHYIMKRSALWDFVRSGKTKDHFWGMRAYTPKERAKVLQGLLQQIESNKWFFLYFLKDDDMLADLQIALYDGKGLLVLSASTKFDLANDHSQVLLTQKDFMEQFKNYFMKVLTADYVMPHREMLNEIRRMIAYCESEIG